MQNLYAGLFNLFTCLFCGLIAFLDYPEKIFASVLCFILCLINLLLAIVNFAIYMRNKNVQNED